MNIQQLEYIVALDELKNFSKAAERCYITQATLSTMVKRLEEEFNTTIFDRKSNPITTTECGKELVMQAKKILHETHVFADLAQSSKLNISGHIRVGIIPTIANALFPIIIEPIMNKFPALQLSFVEITTNNIVKQLREGTIDAGILATPIGANDIEDDVLYYETLMVYNSQKSKGKRYILPKDLKQKKVWMLEEGHCLREQFINLCSLESKHNLPENFNFEANSLDTLLNLVDHFGGLTLIPELYVQQMSSERQSRVSKFKSPIPVREISMVYYRPFAKQRIIAALTKEISALVQPILNTHKYKKSELEIISI
ncbi:MAG: LysR substrate-binding domain-containing protein [Flavobacteriales bacterium]